MISYLIKANFKSGKEIDFTQHIVELENAVKAFNESSEERGKNSSLALQSVSPTDFTLILDSPVQLVLPSKSLAKFSQALTNEPTIKPYVVNGNQLIRCTSTSILNTPKATLTDGQLLHNIVTLIHNTDCCTNSAETDKRKKLLSDIKDLVQSSGLI